MRPSFFICLAVSTACLALTPCSLPAQAAPTTPTFKLLYTFKAQGGSAVTLSEVQPGRFFGLIGVAPGIFSITSAGNYQYFYSFPATQAQLWGTQTTTSVQGQFWPVDYFVPYAVPTGVTIPNNCPPDATGSTTCSLFQIMNQQDWDMGVSGTLLFDDDWYDESCPSLQNYVCHNISMLLSANKRGDGYVLRQYDLGQYTKADQGTLTSQGVVSEFSISLHPSPNSTDEPRMPAYWKPTGAENGFLVIWPWNETLTSFKWTEESNPPPDLTTQYVFSKVATAPPPFAGITWSKPPSPSTAGYAGGALMLTVNPIDSPAAAIVWAVAEPYPNLFPAYPPGPCIQTDGIVCLGYLFAYKLDGTSGPSSGALTQIWPAAPPTNTTVPDFLSTPFASPTAAHGHVYVPTFGLCTNMVSGACQGSVYYDHAGVQAYN